MKTLVRSARPSDLEYEEDEAFERAQWFADCEEYNLLEAQCHQHEAAYHEDMSEEEEAEHEARYIEMLDRLEDLSDLTEFNSPHFLVVQAGKKFDTHDLGHRYGIAKSTLWIWRKTKGFPAPLYQNGFIIGKVCWWTLCQIRTWEQKQFGFEKNVTPERHEELIKEAVSMRLLHGPRGAGKAKSKRRLTASEIATMAKAKAEFEGFFSELDILDKKLEKLKRKALC